MKVFSFSYGVNLSPLQAAYKDAVHTLIQAEIKEREVSGGGLEHSSILQ
jgi:hypothetical protein